LIASKFTFSRSTSFRSCFHQNARAFKFNPDEWLIENDAWLIKTKHGGSEASAFLAGGFFRAQLLIEEVTNLFDENGREIFMRAVGRKINLAGVAAVAAPEPRHCGGGKCMDDRQERKVGAAEGVEVSEGRGPKEMTAVDALQISFGGRAGSPTDEREQESS
jgi:hypothetical protein